MAPASVSSSPAAGTAAAAADSAAPSLAPAAVAPGLVSLEPQLIRCAAADGASGSRALRGVAELARDAFLRRHEDDTSRHGRLQCWLWAALMVFAATRRADLFVRFTAVQAQSQTSIQRRRYSAFWDGRRQMLVVILQTAVAVVMQEFAAGRLKILWRRAAAAATLRSYLNDDNAFYKMKLDGSVDNPDHRITSDVQTSVDYSVDLASKLPEHFVKFFGLTALMWRTSPVTCFFLWAYAAAGTLVTRRGFESNLAWHEVVTQQVEARLRFALVRIGECAEGIAFYGAGGTERRRLLVMFERLVSAQLGLLSWTTAFQAFQEVYSRVGTMLPSLITAPLFWQGRIEFGAISQMFAAFKSVKEILLFFAGNYDKLAFVSARVERLEALRRFPASTWTAQVQRSQIKNSVSKRGEPLLCMRDVRVAVPSADSMSLRWLGRWEGVSLELPPGGSLLIRGESGVGKSSLLRAIAGLWKEGVGEIQRSSSMFFLPQTPYLPAGEYGTTTTLREQLVYPEAIVPDAVLREALKDVNLDWLIGALSSRRDWSTALSGGEKQRVVFARLLAQLPLSRTDSAVVVAPLVLLDEATCACSEALEAKLYAALTKRLSASGGALVSVGHRSSLSRFHECTLTLEPEET